MRRAVTAALAIAALALTPATAAAVTPRPRTAALQVALTGLHLYSGPIDGIAGPRTRRAVRRLQRRARLSVDGVAGRHTRHALGWRGRPSLGSRVMHRGDRGWDVSELQFLLARRGFSPGSIDGGFGRATRAAVIRFQRSSGLGADGLAGRATLRKLRHAGGSPTRTGAVVQGPVPDTPVRFLRPVQAPIGDGFGHPGGRRHDGVDFLAPAGMAVGAAGVGVVSFAGWNSGGYGNLVIVRHRLGFETWYAHLSRIVAVRGQAVSGGTVIGYVGSTGRATGPHLHFEAHHDGVAFNPIPLLLN